MGRAIRTVMEKINIHIEKLPEGIYLASSEDIQGLVAQGRTASEVEVGWVEERNPTAGMMERKNINRGKGSKGRGRLG